MNRDQRETHKFEHEVEVKTTSTVGAEMYRDAKRFGGFIAKMVKYLFLGGVALGLIGYIYSEYESNQRAVSYEKRQQEEAQIRQKERAAARARAISLDTAHIDNGWNDANSLNADTWGNTGWVFTSDGRFMLNVDSSGLTPEQKAMYSDKKLACSLSLKVGSYSETLVSDFVGIQSGYMSSNFVLTIHTSKQGLNKTAQKFESYHVKCGDLFQNVRYNDVN
ncbi:hypothetical protein [Vibrio owensii]|uniref:hypothetical protein n=1 Tax=Vibrio owensii TaxID=696485 RepID=UPI0018F15219|nr:hypothetical protein [Vibrio owensii]